MSKKKTSKQAPKKKTKQQANPENKKVILPAHLIEKRKAIIAETQDIQAEKEKLNSRIVQLERSKEHLQGMVSQFLIEKDIAPDSYFQLDKDGKTVTVFEK